MLERGITYVVRTLAERPEYRPLLDRLSAECWPPFLLHGDVGRWHLLYETYAGFQLLLCDPDGSVLAAGQAVPLVWDGTTSDLPLTISEIIERAEDARTRGLTPNTISALTAMVGQGHRGRNLSRAVVQEMRVLARSHGCPNLIAPVRPTWKSRYPLTPMERYTQWERDDGTPFDPWLRVHWRLGAVPLCVAPSTLTVEGSVGAWESWTGMAFPESGIYVVPGALQPVEIDRKRDRGRYEDPNLWMHHAVQEGTKASGSLNPEY